MKERESRNRKEFLLSRIFFERGLHMSALACYYLELARAETDSRGIKAQGISWLAVSTVFPETRVQMVFPA